MVETLSPYLSPISPIIYPQLAIFLLIVGIFFFSWFFIYEVTSGTESSRKRILTKELKLAGIASVFLGFGTLFLLLWTGVYV